MDRPDDIPQDVWDGAIKAMSVSFRSGTSAADQLVEATARAIMTDRTTRRPARFGGLTAHQKRALDYIRSYAAEHGISPSYDEIKAFLGLASKSGVSRVVHELEQRGAIELLPNRPRSISVPIH